MQQGEKPRPSRSTCSPPKVGLECAGAVQFCDPATMADTAQPGGVDWLTSAQTEEMVAEMVSRTTPWGRQLRRSAFRVTTNVASQTPERGALWCRPYDTILSSDGSGCAVGRLPSDANGWGCQVSMPAFN